MDCLRLFMFANNYSLIEELRLQYQRFETQSASVGFGIANLTLSGNNIALKSDPTKILATLTGIDTTSLTASNFAFI